MCIYKHIYIYVYMCILSATSSISGNPEGRRSLSDMSFVSNARQIRGLSKELNNWEATCLRVDLAPWPFKYALSI